LELLELSEHRSAGVVTGIVAVALPEVAALDLPRERRGVRDRGRERESETECEKEKETENRERGREREALHGPPPHLPIPIRSRCSRRWDTGMPHGGLRPFYQKSTYLTQLTLWCKFGHVTLKISR